MNHKSGKDTKSPGKVLPGKKDPLYFAFLLFMVLYLAGTFLVMALHEPWVPHNRCFRCFQPVWFL